MIRIDVYLVTRELWGHSIHIHQVTKTGLPFLAITCQLCRGIRELQSKNSLPNVCGHERQSHVLWPQVIRCDLVWLGINLWRKGAWDFGMVQWWEVHLIWTQALGSIPNIKPKKGVNLYGLTQNLSMAGTVLQTYNPNTVEGWGRRIWNQPELHSKTSLKRFKIIHSVLSE